VLETLLDIMLSVKLKEVESSLQVVRAPNVCGRRERDKKSEFALILQFDRWLCHFSPLTTAQLPHSELSH
jgi:hypothetical protein